jgi:hypothetical protein
MLAIPFASVVPEPMNLIIAFGQSHVSLSLEKEIFLLGKFVFPAGPVS